MVNVNALGGYDNVSEPPGWTNQATTPTAEVGTSLESYGAGTLGTTSTPSQNSYLAWSLIPEDAIAQPTHSTTGFVTRVVAQTGGSCAHMDVWVHAGTTPNIVAAIWPASGPVGVSTPLVWSLAAGTALSTGPAMGTVTWNGASSPASVTLVAGVTYYVYTYISTATTSVAGSTMADPGMANANLTATTYSTATLNSALTSVTSASVLTAATNSASKIWVGLRA